MNWLILSLPGWRDIVALLVYIVYQCLFLVLPVRYIFQHDLPPGSAIICTTEQVGIVFPVLYTIFILINASHTFFLEEDGQMPPILALGHQYMNFVAQVLTQESQLEAF